MQAPHQGRAHKPWPLHRPSQPTLSAALTSGSLMVGCRRLFIWATSLDDFRNWLIGSPLALLSFLVKSRIVVPSVEL